MVRLSALLAGLLAVSAACGANTATQEPVRESVQQTAPTPEAPAAIRVPENPVDRAIRRDLTVAVARDADLQHRDISFHVVNGDVSVMGTVRSEDERKKFNDLAMNIGGVKSVANGLRIEE